MGESPRTNEVRRPLDSGDVALGILDNTDSPTLGELYGDLGLDFVWLDLEHTGPSRWNADRIDDFLRVPDLTGTELLVRLPTPEPGLVRKALHAGVRNVFIPRIETAEEVRRAVRAARFRYDDGPGERGLASPRASRLGEADDYVDTEDEEILVGVAIENMTAIGNLDDILAVPGLGFVFVGPLDLSVSVGHPGDLDHSDVQEAVETVRLASIDAEGYLSAGSVSAWRT